MDLLWTLVVGLVVGALAKFIMPGKDPGGIIITIILGICGALLAKYLGQALGIYAPGEAAGFLGALVGAILLLWIYRMVRRNRP
jgi:uncharacterized membrane protein YeaQ/YmgE (transglycosylase-associated protein family)